MPNADYHAMNDHLNRSFMTAVDKYGGEAQQWMDQGHSLFAGNKATTLGSRFDTLISGACEGKQFSEMVAIPPADVLASNGARRGGKYDEWKARSAARGLIDCSAEEAWQLEVMYDHLFANDAARQLVEETTETQVSVFFELNGHRCRVRPDGCTPTLWWDLKTTSSTWDKLHLSAREFGYYEQEWFYVQAAMALGMEHHRMPFVFVQTMPPFKCKVFYQPVDLVEEAGRRMVRVMEEIRLRRETGIYEPADAGEITEMVVPAWARKQEEEVITL
jgi:hypothetical protein